MATRTSSIVSKLCPTGKLPRIIYNDDSCTLRTAPPPHSLDTLACSVDYLKGTQVDCLCWCVGEQIAYSWPSRVIENIFEMYDRGVKHGAAWAFTERDVMYSLHKQGIDYLPHLIERARRQGLMFVASFRMNDTHIKSYPNSVLTPEFWRTHQHYRLWEATDAKGYYNAALDYSFPEVRRRYRDAIMEVARNYDVDGIELDFTRTPYLFQPSEAWSKRSILTRFVRDIHDRLDTLGVHRGKPYALVLRIPSRERSLATAGIDAVQWIKLRLPTILVVSEMVINLNQHLEPWKSLCRQAGIGLYPSVEACRAYNRTEFYSTLPSNPLAPRHDGGGSVLPPERETALQRAAAGNFHAQGADGIYLFNFACRVAEGKNVLHADRRALTNITVPLREIGRSRTLARKPRWYAFYQDLPIHVETNRPRRFHQTLAFDIRGQDLRHATVTLRFHQIAEKKIHTPRAATVNTRSSSRAPCAII